MSDVIRSDNALRRLKDILSSFTKKLDASIVDMPSSSYLESIHNQHLVNVKKGQDYHKSYDSRINLTHLEREVPEWPLELAQRAGLPEAATPVRQGITRRSERRATRASKRNTADGRRNQVGTKKKRGDLEHSMTKKVKETYKVALPFICPNRWCVREFKNAGALARHQAKVHDGVTKARDEKNKPKKGKRARVEKKTKKGTGRRRVFLDDDNTDAESEADIVRTRKRETAKLYVAFGGFC